MPPERCPVAERAEIEVTDRAGIEDAIIGQHQRDRRVELAEAAQHPSCRIGLSSRSIPITANNFLAMSTCRPRCTP